MTMFDAALRIVSKEREYWMMLHGDDWDADYFAGLFDNAIVSIEKLKEACMKEAPNE